ncbi:MAG: diaminopimelate decarboxylase [Verrucomicrobia bacterium]|nr:diaminopimelate decarboxylase [Verrucomicrobiota bacterium]
MHSFRYRQGLLHCERASLEELASNYGTPLYVYSSQTILEHYRKLDLALADLDHEICFALKANSNISVLQLLAKEGSGFDIVSGGELYRVIRAGGDPRKCTFAGAGKTADEIAYALSVDVLSFNVESEQELIAINEIAGRLGKIAPVALRVNPDVAVETHKYISTGKAENKFGIGFERIPEVYRNAARLRNLRLCGIQTHIGSQITEVSPFAEVITKLLPLVASLQKDYGIEFFSIGGGIGIAYHDALQSGDQGWWKNHEPTFTIQEYADALLPILRGIPVRVLIEPGRYLVGNAGVLLTRVLYIKESPTKTFVIVDSGMNDLIRPALYQGYHEIVPVRESASEKKFTVDVVGPVCESGDFFAQGRELPAIRAGEVLALMSAGAYGFTMASNYNSRLLPAEILVTGADAQIVRRRQTYDDLISLEMG